MLEAMQEGIEYWYEVLVRKSTGSILEAQILGLIAIGNL